MHNKNIWNCDIFWADKLLIITYIQALGVCLLRVVTFHSMTANLYVSHFPANIMPESVILKIILTFEDFVNWMMCLSDLLKFVEECYYNNLFSYSRFP